MEQFRVMNERAEGLDHTMLRFGSLPPPTGSPALPARGHTPSSTDGVSASLSLGNSATSSTHQSYPLNLEDRDVLLSFVSECDTTNMNPPRIETRGGRGMSRSLVTQTVQDKGETSAQRVVHNGKQPINHIYQHTDARNLSNTQNSGLYPQNTFPPPYESYPYPTQFPCLQPLSNPVYQPYSQQYESYPYPTSAIFGPLPYFSTQPFHSNPLPSHQPSYTTTTTITPLPLSYQPSNPTHQTQQGPYSPPHNAANHGNHSDGNYGNQNHFDPTLPSLRQMRLEFSIFGGGDPVEWLHKAEKFFEFYQVPKERKVFIAALHLVDKAADRWFMFKHEFPNSWKGLSELLMREFSVHNFGEYQAALARISQEGRAPGFSSQALLSFFIERLRPSIRIIMRAHRPASLYEACELAKLFERGESQQRFQRVTGPPRHQATPLLATPLRAQVPPPHIIPRAPVAPTVGNLGAGRNFGGTRRLTQAEYQERRARNQCFFCDEIFRPGHNCRRGQALMVIEVLQEEAPQPILNDLPHVVVDDVNQADNGGEEEEIELRAMGDGSASTM
uniref:uncharacterized protein LOC105351847 n=1 Tax=Fragaria vesca subsp. vesca TaxID=101020 RepID=UPI0005CA970D|nr:PREDICTED: uncharacterized protein LOC105351847 [Fragaria vesca subsp. vesca]